MHAQLLTKGFFAFLFAIISAVANGLFFFVFGISSDSSVSNHALLWL